MRRVPAANTSESAESEVEPRPCHFVGAANDEMRELPGEVQDVFGYNLWLIQNHETPHIASPFEGSTGTNIMKLTDRYDGDTYRCVYAAKFERAVYVLHVFQKKSKAAIATPHQEIELVRRRYQTAVKHYKEHYER